MGSGRKLLLILFTVLLLFILGWDIWLHTLPSHTTPWNYLRTAIFGLFFLIGGIAAITGAFRVDAQNNSVKMMSYFGYAMLAYWVSSTTWALFAIFTKDSNPNNTIVNIFYVFLYPFGFIGMWHLFRLYQQQITLKFIFSLFIVLLVSFSVVFGIFALPALSEKVTFSELLPNAYFIVGDVIMFSLVMAIVLIGKVHNSLYILAFGLFIVVIASMFFIYRTTLGIYWQGDIADTLYTTGCFFATLGIVEIINNSQSIES